MDFTFIHAADLHLDTPFIGIGQTSPRVAEALQDASLDAFDALIDLTLHEDARFLLLAGDLYDGAQRGIRAQRRFERGLRRLSDRGIRTFIVNGNHDPLSGWSAIRDWPPWVTSFGSQEVESVAVMDGEERLATVYGISYPQAKVEENLSLRFRRQDAEGLHIGLLHANVEGNAEHAPYSPCTLDDLKRAGMDYWALGHVHTRQILSLAPWVVYPGNLQGRSPKPSERGAKGAMVVRVTRERHGASGAGFTVQAPRFVPLDRIRFDTLELDLGGIPDVASLQRTLISQAERLQAEHEGRGLVLRGILKGRGEVYSELLHPGRLSEILVELRRDGEQRDPLIAWEDLRNEAASPLDLALIRQRGDFSAELLRLHDDRLGDPERSDAFLKAALSPLERFSSLLNEPDPDEAEALLREARILALDLLERE
ncbi:putative metallophosphoesterase YhaO [compost metagenome]